MPGVIRDGSELDFDTNDPFVTYLDHNHREGENIRFLTICPFTVQDLWCGPSRGVTLFTRGAPNRIQVLGDPSEAKIRDPCTAGIIHENIWLEARQ